MDTSVEEEFILSDFSPRSLTFIPGLNCVLASNWSGETRTVDVVTGKVQKCPDIAVPPSSSSRPSPVLVGLHDSSSRVVVAASNLLGGRSVHKGCVLLNTILQVPVSKKEDRVTVEIPAEQAPSLVKELQKSFLRSSSSAVIKEINTLLLAQSKLSQGAKFMTASFTGSVGKLTEIFLEVLTKLKASTAQPSRGVLNSTPVPTLLPLMAALAFRLYLLHPEHYPKISKLETGELGISMTESKLMHVEGLRRLSLSEWPHDYEWAVPRTMAEAGFYHLAGPQGNSVTKGDRVTCFSCRVYLYSWDPTDEPWSEHERHAIQCPYIRGEYTDNVPLEETESSCPAYRCSKEEGQGEGSGEDRIVVLGTSVGTELIAVGMEWGRVILLDMDSGLLITERASLHLTSDVVTKWLERRIDSAPLFSHTVSAPMLPPQVRSCPQIPQMPQTTSTALSESTSLVPPSSSTSLLPQMASTPLPPATGYLHLTNTPSAPQLDGTLTPQADNMDDATTSSQQGENADSAPTGEEEATVSDSDSKMADGADVKVQPTVDSSVASPEQVSDDTKTSEPLLTSETAKPLPTVSDSSEASEVPKSKHSFHVTALSVFTRSSDCPPKSSSSTSTKSADSSPCTMLVTGLTSVHPHTQQLVPMLLVHLVKTKSRSNTTKSKSSLFPTPFGQSPADFLDIADPISNPIPLSTGSNESLATVDIVDGIPLTEFACGAESGCMPEVGQIVPLAGGVLLAVTCSTADDKSNTKYSVLLLFRVSLAGKLEAECVASVLVSSPECHICPVTETPQLDRVLLACVSGDGEVCLYSCVGGRLERLSDRQCCTGQEGERVTSCTYCPTTTQLFVSLENGKVLGVKFHEQQESGVERSTDLLQRDLDSSDFDDLLSLVTVSPLGEPFTCSSSVHWKEISLLWYNRRSPLHMNVAPECLDKKAQHKKDNLNNCRILQYEPMLESSSDRFTFELVMDAPEVVPVGCVSVKLTFANIQCISNDATISLALPAAAGEESADSANKQQLCGPIKLKPLADVTEQSLQIFLSHPALLHTRSRVLLLSVEHLFSSDYKEVSFVESVGGGLDAYSRRQAWRNRAFRHQAQSSAQADNKVTIPVQASLTISIYPLAGSPDTLKQSSITFSQLASAIHDPSFILRVTVAACNGTVESNELRNLPAPLQDSVRGGVARSREVQQKALDVLMWMGLVHCSGADSGGYALMVDCVSQLLVSLLHACFIDVGGDRLLSHKVSQLLIMLYRFECDTDTIHQFRLMLSESLLYLLPLLPLFSSASCVHWFLRLLSTLTGPADSPNISSICHRLLVNLSRVLSTKDSLPAQILQTKHEGSVFEPELFDIYLSYCQKSSSVMAKSKSLLPSAVQSSFNTSNFTSNLASAYIYASTTDLNTSYPQEPMPLMAMPQSPTSQYYLTTPPTGIPVSAGKPLLASYPKKVVVPGISGTVPAGTTHIVTDKGGHTIYDSELKLLLDSKKTESQSKKFVEDFTTYKHGSFLLYSQRGLLETLPLTYTCLSVTGNATVLEPNIHTLPQAPEHQSTQTQVSLISKTTGYSYPSGAVEAEQKREFSSLKKSASTPTTHPIPQILTDINITPKELMMQIESLKSGVPYSALLKFAQPVALTDISIPATGTMSSVSVDVWLEPEGEKGCVRVAQSSEIKTRSLMMGNLTPPPVCQYVKVTFLGSLTNTREMAQVFIGAFYGLPLFPPDQAPSTEQLHSLEERLLTQYYLHRDSLTSALLSYASLHTGAPNLQQYEEKVSVEYQQCFKMQVSLARLRHFMKRTAERDDSSKGGVFQLPEESDINYGQYSISKLSKMVGCLVDALLALNIDTPARKSQEVATPPGAGEQAGDYPELEDEGLVLDEEGYTGVHGLTQEECRVLFYTLCIHGIPKMHARAIALLIKYCGSQHWWGGFIVSVAANLFGEHQTDIFNKERALLQLSAMSQHTYSTSDLLPCILNFLREKLAQFLHTTTTRDQAMPTKISDHTILRWMVMLLTHFLSSVVSSDPQCNLFVPLPTNPPSAKFSKVAEVQREEPSRGKEREDSKETLMEMHKEVKKMLGYVHTVVESSSKDTYKIAVKQQLESKLKEYRYLRQRLAQRDQASSPSASSPPDSSVAASEPQKADSALSVLPQELCHAVVKGLVKYVLTLCKGDCDTDFIPVVSKCVSLLVSATKWSYPLHTLVTQQELHQLLAYSTASHLYSSTSSINAASLATSLEWRRRTLQNLCMSILYHGEVRPCLEVAKVNCQAHTKACQTVKVKKVKFRSLSTGRLIMKKKYEYIREKKSVKGSSVHYSTFVISNSIESRRLYMPDTIPELQLQKIAKGVYGSILLSLLNARPLAPRTEAKSEGTAADVYLEKLGSAHCSCVFPETVSILIGSIEHLLTDTTSRHQLLNNVDLLLVLALWHEMNETLATPYNQAAEQLDLDGPLLVYSEQCCVILMDYLLNQPSVSPTIWQASLANILSGLQRRKELFVDYDKLLSVLVKFLVSSSGAASSRLIVRIVGALLGEERRLVSTVMEGKLSGACLLLDVLIRALDKRDVVHQDYSLLYELAKTLAGTQNDYLAEPDYAVPSHIYHLIHQLCHLVANLVPQAFNENTFPGVELFGSEIEDVSRRKHYTTLNDLHKRTWVPTTSEGVGLSQLVSQLLQLLLKIFSDKCGLSPPTTSYMSLEHYCCEKFSTGDDTDYLMLAHPQVQSLSLVYADTELLFKFLQLLNMLTAHMNRNVSGELALYEEFVLFLYNNCQDHSCFFRPIQRVLETSPGNSRLSKLFISLITRAPTRAFRGRSKPHDTAEFIRCGGGVMVLRNLIGSSKQQTQGVLRNSGGFSVHAINKLGQRDTPHKTISDSSNLVDFFPVCSTYRTSSKGTSKVTQSAQSYSLFQHTFSPGEKWVQLHIISPHPILLHNFICCLIPMETGSTSHGSPSKMALECSVHGGQHSLVPVTPVFVTDSLKIINVAFHQPVLTQHTVVHFHHPLLSGSMVVSRVEFLGTSFGSHAQSITSRSSTASVPTQQDQEHQGAGWMDIVDQWLHSAEEAVQALKALFVDLPDLLPSCLAMLNNRQYADKKFVNQLENLLIAIADQCPDHGMTILHHLLGFSPISEGSEVKSQDRTEDSFSFCLLSKLCEPTSDVNRQRLAVSVRLLSNLPPSAPPPSRHTPSLVCALSNMIWHGKDIEDICHEETFRSLVELAFSLELGSHYKMSMNSLLCALCCVNPSHFSLLLASCEDVLISEPEMVGHRLSTLAGAAQSFHCTEVLLGSELIAKMISRLTNGFEKLLDLAYSSTQETESSGRDSLQSNLRGMVSSLSSLLAFFADFFRHWRPGKEWMASTDNHRFWSPMIQFLCMDTSVISALEASFIQEVAFNFFSVCLFGCEMSKRVFIQLVCDFLHNQCGSGSGMSKPVLTPFLHKLLVGLVFQHDYVPVILKVVTSPEQSKGIPTGPLSLPTTCEVLDFHPSHPIGESCYYLRVPGSFTLAQLETLVKSHNTVKATPSKSEPKKMEKSVHKKLSSPAKSLPAKISVPKPLPSTVATTEVDSMDVANFKLKDWKVGKLEKNVDSRMLSYYTLDGGDVSEGSVYRDLLSSYSRQGEEDTTSSRSEGELLRDLVPVGADYPLLIVLDHRAMYFGARCATACSPDMFGMLVSYDGLTPLAKSVPPLYPYLWPSSLVSGAGGSLESDPVVGSQQLFKPYSILGQPVVAPFRSMVLFGQCLQLAGFGKVLGENPSAAYMLMRLLLGEEVFRDSTPKALTESFSYLPYLIILETLRKYPATTEEGRGLRVRVQEVGVLQLVLQCLSLASHHSPRVEGEGETVSTTDNIPLQNKTTHAPKKVASSLDKQYWAKGTGFGTGSTASSYNMVAVRAKHKSEEKYVSICFAILSEYLSWDAGEGPKGRGEGGAEGTGEEEGVFLPSSEDYCTVEVIELLCRSCMLPALASYLLNDSVLDICKHVELYQTMLHLVSSLAGNPATQHLLTLPVFSAGGGQSSSDGVTSLASLIAKLRDIAVIYQKTAKVKEPKAQSQKPPSPVPPKDTTTVTDATAAAVAASLLLGEPHPAPSVIKPLIDPLKPEDSPPDTTSPPEQLTQEEVDLLVSDASTDDLTNLEKQSDPYEEVASLFMEGDLSMEPMKASSPDPVDTDGAEGGKTGLVTSSEVEDALIPQLSTVYDELKVSEGDGDTNMKSPKSGVKENQDIKLTEDAELQIKLIAEAMARGIIRVGLGQLQEEATLASGKMAEKSVRETQSKLQGVSEGGNKQTCESEERDLKAPPVPPPPPPIPTSEKTAPPLPPRMPTSIKKVGLSRAKDRTTKVSKLTSSDEADLVELVNKILSVSDEVGGVVKALKREAGQYSRQTSTSTPLTETPQEAAFAYVKAMKPLQFDTYCFTSEDETGKISFTCTYQYQAQVLSANAATQDASRARRLAQEISTLSTSLPISPSSTVFVRCDEERLDVMKVLITGPSDTPYANGCFEFDVFFPHDYPKSPMLVNLKTTGHGRVRFNPNLYNDGKVCLSVLNTWHGRPEEKWNGQTSSLLQVLVSIQSLILVPEPYFNEPGYEQSRGTPYGDQKSITYSSNIAVATMQWAMINQIRNPTPCFKQVILQHFLLRKDSICSQYEVWKCELEEAIKKAKVGDTSVHLLRDHLHSLVKSMDTLKVELEKLKMEDIQPVTGEEGGHVS